MDSINNNNELMDILHIKQVLTNMQVGFWTIEIPIMVLLKCTVMQPYTQF